MKKTKLVRVEDNVEYLLSVFPRTRSSDNELIIMYLMVYHNTTNLREIPFEKLPCFESITRARRHLQYTLGKYKAGEETEEYRDKQNADHAFTFKK